jgi:hypothetical protein
MQRSRFTTRSSRRDCPRRSRFRPICGALRRISVCRSGAAPDFAWSKVRLLPVARLPSPAGSRSRPTGAASSILCSHGMRAMRDSIPSSPPMMSGCKPTPSSAQGLQDGAPANTSSRCCSACAATSPKTSRDAASEYASISPSDGIGGLTPCAVSGRIRGTQCFFCALVGSTRSRQALRQYSINGFNSD